MSFDSFSEFLAMGGHGLYVWLSYGIVLVLFIINLAGPLLRKKQLISELTRRLRREQKKHESKA
ncbi:MAG: heme exporter protein CcmD [Pontibacterium sp.]